MEISMEELRRRRDRELSEYAIRLLDLMERKGLLDKVKCSTDPVVQAEVSREGCMSHEIVELIPDTSWQVPPMIHEEKSEGGSKEENKNETWRDRPPLL